MSTAELNRTSARWRAAVWVPAVLLVSWGLLAANGQRLQPNAHASSSGNVTVTATVGDDIHITSVCGSTPPAAGTAAFGSIAGDGLLAESAVCPVIFGTNNHTAGATLNVKNAVAGNFFCWDTDTDPSSGRTCSGSKQFTDFTGSNAALTADNFGARVNTYAGATCSGSPTWAAGANKFNGIPTSASAAATITTTTAVGNCTANIVFGAKAASITASTTGPQTYYDGQAYFNTLVI